LDDSVAAAVLPDVVLGDSHGTLAVALLYIASDKGEEAVVARAAAAESYTHRAII